jgi:hypothetical protein
MTLSPVLFCALGVLGMSLPLMAELVQVTGVEGQVLYGAGDRTPTVPVKAGQMLAAGTFVVASNGILYLSTFSGSELRVAETGTLRFDGVEEPCPVENHAGHRSTFRLLQGKLLVTIRHTETTPHCYRIVVRRGNASVESGQCVMCMHGDGTYVYVARGRTMLSGSGESPGLVPPPRGAPTAVMAPARQTEIVIERPSRLLTGNGKIGLLQNNGSILVMPLAAVSAPTQSCLLAGFKSDGAGSGFRPAVDSNRAIVSPIQ